MLLFGPGIVFIIVGTYMFLDASVAHNLILAAKDLELSSGSAANELQGQQEADIKSVWVENISYLFNVLFRVPIKICHATFHSSVRPLSRSPSLFPSLALSLLRITLRLIYFVSFN